EGLRASGYFTMAGENYFVPDSTSRQIDLALWIADERRWLFLEVKPCWQQGGYLKVLEDAKKLTTVDKSRDPRDQLRGILAYGFKWAAGPHDEFPEKYESLSQELGEKGFTTIGVDKHDLEGPTYPYIQVGLWVTGL